MKKQSRVLLSLPLLLSGAFASDFISVNYQNEKFSLPEIRHSKSLLTLNRKIMVSEFRETFMKRFGSTDSCLNFMSKSLMDSLAKALPGLSLSWGPEEFPSTANIDDFNVEATGSINNPAIANKLDSLRKAGEARYFLYVSKIDVDNIEGASASGLVAGGKIGEGNISGGHTEKCVVSMEVEIWDMQKHLRRMTFTSFGVGQMSLISGYERTLNNAIQGSMDHLVEYLKNGKSEF